MQLHFCRRSQDSYSMRYSMHTMKKLAPYCFTSLLTHVMSFLSECVGTDILVRMALHYDFLRAGDA